MFREIFFVGTEWSSYHELFAFPWDFSHLAEHLSEPGRFKHTPHLFGQSEPTLLEFDDGRPPTVVPVPVLVAVDCGIPPPELVGLKSVQKAEELIKSFAEVRLSWVPSYGPQEERSMLRAATEGAHPFFQYLRCNKRKACINVLSEERLKEFDYLNPYIWFPHKETFDGNTVAKVLFCLDNSVGAKFIEVDWEDRDDEELLGEEGVLEVMQDEGIPDTPENRSKLAEAMKEAIAESRKGYAEARKAFREKQSQFSPEVKEALKNIHLIKYYPKNFTKATSKYINRYYRHAHEVYPENVSTEY